MVTVLYFARLREALGKSSEQIELPAGVSDVQSLRTVLRGRGATCAEEMADGKQVRAAVNQDIPFFTPYTFDIVKRWHYDHVMDFPVAGIFSPAWVAHPRDVPPVLERSGFRTVELVSSQSVAGDVQGHLALFAERQPELHSWVIDELVKIANDPTIIGSAWHLLYIGRKP